MGLSICRPLRRTLIPERRRRRPVGTRPKLHGKERAISRVQPVPNTIRRPEHRNIRTTITIEVSRHRLIFHRPERHRTQAAVRTVEPEPGAGRRPIDRDISPGITVKISWCDQIGRKTKSNADERTVR